MASAEETAQTWEDVIADLERQERVRSYAAAILNGGQPTRTITLQGQGGEGRKTYLTDAQIQQINNQPAPLRFHHYALTGIMGFCFLFALCAMGRPGA